MEKYLLMSCLLLTGCATTYQSGNFSFTGGYFDSPVNDKLEKVVFAANGFTSVETTVKYTLFHCAEIAQEKEKPYFLVYNSLRQAAFGAPSQNPATGVVGGKPASYAYLFLSDVESPGAHKTSDIIAELNAHKESTKKTTTQTKNKNKSS